MDLPRLTDREARGQVMSPPKVLVFFLRLISLGAVLLTLSFVFAVFLIPEEIPPDVRGYASPGCFGVIILVLLLPLSIIPAFVAWVIQERVVRPREAAAEHWRSGATLREERLGSWMRYLVDLAAKHRSESSLAQADIPRAIRELDHARGRRLLKFLREIEWKDGREETLILEGSDSGAGVYLPRRWIVSVASSLLALASGFFFFWAGLIAVMIITVNPLQALGAGYSKIAQIFIACGDVLILSLVLGLAAAGLRRMYRQAEKSLEENGGDRKAVQAVALKYAREQLGVLAQWETAENADAEQFARKVARALLAVATPDLDAGGRADLVRSFYEAGWLDGRLSLKGLDLRGMELAGAKLPEVCLADADLSGADLSNADLSRADLRHCTLCGSDLRFTRLGGSNLLGADLRYARLHKAKLEGAVLRDVLLDGANFWGSGLAGADLTGARGSAENLAAVS